MNLYISVTSPPKIHVSEHDIGGTIDLDMTINVLDSSEVIPVACISLVSLIENLSAAHNIQPFTNFIHFLFDPLTCVYCASWEPGALAQVINTSCFPEIKGDNLAGVIRLNDFKASLTWSRIGNLNMHIFQVYLVEFHHFNMRCYIDLCWVSA